MKKKEENKVVVKTSKSSAVKEIKEVLEPMKQPKPRTFQEISLAEIKINPLNPRKNFSGPQYDNLLASIRTKGVIVPVLLRPLSSVRRSTDAMGKEYEIIAGERRFRAACEVAKGNGCIENGNIPAIVQEMSDDDAYDCMTVENLQRADLTPLEEARAFKLYLDRKGPDALQDLAERVSINPCYIRRRTAVLSLPENILSAWENGDIAYGHLEQLVRVSDPKERGDLFSMAKHQGMSIKRMKENIESRTPKLSSALFAKPLAGCLTCPQNTDVQRNLFGDDVATKALCLVPDCYKKHQGEWIQSNWPKFKSSRKLDTNGARFRDDVRWEDRHSIYSKIDKKCKSCEHFQSLISLDGKVDDKQICLGPKKCHDATYNPRSEAAKKAADPNAPRVSWHGEFFREEFFKSRIPELVKTLPSDDEKVLRIALLTILEMHDVASLAFDEKYNSGKNSSRGYGWDHSAKSWPILEGLQGTELRSILQELSLLILMSQTTTAATRRQVAVHLGSDLTAEWRLTKEYLDKKTTKEIHAIAKQFGFFEEDKARAYLYETLGKKRDRFDTCKKAELVKVILESGIDLSGKVPVEILKP